MKNRKKEKRREKRRVEEQRKDVYVEYTYMYDLVCVTRIITLSPVDEKKKDVRIIFFFEQTISG